MEWEPPPRSGGPGAREVHVWRLSLDLAVALPDSPLSPDERERAARFRLDRDRERFARARIGLRLLLGWYLGREPAAIDFAYGRFGKPALRGDPLEFNLSHSGGWAVYAVSRSGPVGVDVEAVRADLVDLDAAGRLFSPAVHRSIVTAPADRRAAAFVDAWTSHEAMAKATGRGIGSGFAGIELTGGAASRRPVRVGDADPARRSWCVERFTPAAGHLGAVAAPGTAWTLRTFDFRPQIMRSARDGRPCGCRFTTP